MPHDEIYRGFSSKVADFAFTERVASVFDDMVSRSVPFYDEIQNLAVELAIRHLQPGGVVYDIGCSTGTTISRMLSKDVHKVGVTFVGIEPSGPMAAKAKEKLNQMEGASSVRIEENHVEDLKILEQANAVIMLFTLQFVRPARRQSVLNTIYSSLVPGGCVLLAEKILSDNSALSREYIEIYHSRKNAAGYTDEEVAKKREALENVLVPYRDGENRDLMSRAGFLTIDTLFRWCNFALYIGIKS